MGMFGFSARKPRKFRRISIYTDEGRDNLQKLVQDTLREEGKLPQEEKTYDPTKFNGTFSNYTPRAQRYSEKERRLTWPIAIVIIFGLIVVWRFIMTGMR